MIHREQDIIQWGIDRNLIGTTGEATCLGQQKKTEEEVKELREAIEGAEAFTHLVRHGLINARGGRNFKEEAKDAIGDIIVTLVMQAQMWGLTMEECIEAAWQEIKNRKGRMTGGVFVKEAPPAPSSTQRAPFSTSCPHGVPREYPCCICDPPAPRFGASEKPTHAGPPISAENFPSATGHTRPVEEV